MVLRALVRSFPSIAAAQKPINVDRIVEFRGMNRGEKQFLAPFITFTERTEVLEENLSQSHFVHHKSRMI
jgi:hypothetical protein